VHTFNDAVLGSSSTVPAALAIESSTEKLYWADYNTNTISQSDLSGNGIVTIATGPSAISALAPDAAGGKLYWNDDAGIRRANLLPNSPVETLVSGESYTYSMLALAYVPPPAPTATPTNTSTPTPTNTNTPTATPTNHAACGHADAGQYHQDDLLDERSRYDCVSRRRRQQPPDDCHE